jgi:hypothetical protein
LSESRERPQRRVREQREAAKTGQRAERGRKDGSESREKPRRRVREPEKPQGRVRREKAAAAATADRPTNRQVDMHVCRQSEKEQVNEEENVW